MLIRIVSKYLESHKRLVVPQLGAFIVKEPGQVLFSELLKRDDGALRELLRAEGLGDLEAAGEIDRFVFEIRHAVEQGIGHPLQGFGLMKPGPNATIVFEYNPQQGVVAPQACIFSCEPTAEPTALSASEPAELAEPAESAMSSEPATSSEPAGVSSSGQVESHASARPPHARSEQEVQTVKTAFSGPSLSRSVKLNPEPYVKGLRYGKPHKNTNAYTYVGHGTRRGGIDRFLLLAIVAATIAVAVIAFGYFRKSREEAFELQQVEQVQGRVNPTEEPNLK